MPPLIPSHAVQPWRDLKKFNGNDTKAVVDGK